MLSTGPTRLVLKDPIETLKTGVKCKTVALVLAAPSVRKSATKSRSNFQVPNKRYNTDNNTVQ